MVNQKTPNPNAVILATETQLTMRTRRVVLVTLHQQQGFQVSVDVAGGAIQCIRGPLDMVKWKELHTLYDAIRAAIVRAGLAEPELLECEPFLLKTVTGWNPVLQLLGNDSDDQTYDLRRIKEIAERTLVGLKRDAANNSDDLLADDLNETQTGAVREVVLEVLNGNGGKRFTTPVHVVVDDQEFKLDGKLGAKLNCANFHPQEVRLTGKFFGFDGQKGELFFLTESGQIHINFEQDLVDLLAVVQTYLDRKECEIRVHKTISKQGAAVYSFLPDGTLKRQL